MKKTVSLSLLLALLLTALIGCASDAEPAPSTTTASPSSQPAETTAEAVTAEPPPYTAPDADFDGRDFRFLTYTARQLNYCFFTATYNGIYTETENGDILNDAIYARNRIVEEELNVKIKNTDCKNDDITILRSSVLAGDDFAETVISSHAGMSAAIKAEGLVLKLNTLSTLQLESPWWDQNANAEYEINGALYTTTGDICLYNTAAMATLYFNKEMISDFSLDNPYELVFDGSWTLDNLIRMAEAVSADLNGNGEADVEDRFGLSGSRTCMTMFMYSGGMRNATKNADGIAEITLNDPRMQTMVEKTVALLRNRSVTMFVADFGGDVTYSLFVPTFIDNRLLFHFNWVHMSFELRDMQADFGILPFPKFDEGQDRYYCYDATGYQQFVLVPATNAILDVTGYVLDSMGYHAMELVTPAFIETSVTDKMLRDEDSARVLAILNSNRVYELYDIFRWGNIGNIIGDLANANSTDFTSKVAAVEGTAKKELAETYEKYGG